MKTSIAVALALAPVFFGTAWADGASPPFDGNWNTVLSCPNNTGALGYSFQFVSSVQNGVLHGQKGVKDQPGWLTIDGPVSEDGAAQLYVDGIVGAAPFAVGGRPAGTRYGYHVNAHFAGASGSGARVEGRPCTVTFNKAG